MIKVCHVTSAHESNDTRIYHKECVSLASAGYETYVVARGESREEKGVHIIGLGEAPSNRLQRMTGFARKVYKVALSLECDIYHFHDPELLPYCLKLKKQGKKVIFDSHENTLEQILEKKWLPKVIRPIASSLYRLYATRIFKCLDGLISVTPHIVDQLKEINPNVWMITNYPLFNPETDLQRKEANGIIHLCFTGGIDEQWDHDQIINCIGNMDGVEYELCGKSSEDYLEALKQIPGWKKVKYYGRVSYDESIKIQKNSDVGVALLCKSRNTGGNLGTLGNTKLFEYMMAGLPVICTDFILWKDIIAKWKCGICVSPDDAGAIISAIKYIKCHPEEASHMGRNGRCAVEQEYNWSIEEFKLLNLYKELGV